MTPSPSLPDPGRSGMDGAPLSADSPGAADRGSLADNEVRALFAVMCGARNVRAVAAEIGRSLFTTHRSLNRLGEAGLVNYGSGTRNTLVVTCQVVAFDGPTAA